MLAIAAQLTTPITALSSMTAPLDAPPWVQLPADDLGSEFTEPTANGTLHLGAPAPRGPPCPDGMLIAEWIAHARPALVVVDVSVEVATLCRLMGVPTVVVAMRGDRTDRAHRTAYDSAHALLAPWASPFVEPGWPLAWYDKTFHAGAISRFGELTPPAQRAGAGRVLVLWGSGGEDDPATPRFRAAEAATPAAGAGDSPAVAPGIGWTSRRCGSCCAGPTSSSLTAARTPSPKSRRPGFRPSSSPMTGRTANNTPPYRCSTGPGSQWVCGPGRSPTDGSRCWSRH